MKILKLNKEKNGLAVGYQMAQAVKEYIEKYKLYYLKLK